ATGSRVSPVTKSTLRDFARAQDGSFLEIADRSRFESPNDNQAYHAKAVFTGLPRTTVNISLRDLNNNLASFDKQLRDQEHLSVIQRGGTAHAEYLPLRGALFAMDGTLDRSLSVYELRTNRNSLVTGRSFHTNLSYTPSWRSRAGVDLSLDHRRNERQSTGNGLTTSHALSAGGAHRVSSRLGLDGTASVTLFSTKFEQPTLDQDNYRTYLNFGALYTVSARCSTSIHYSDTRGHVIAIDPTRSGNNNIQSTFQMDASL